MVALLNTPGKRIRILRMAVGLNQAQLAERIGAGQNTVSAWEKGARPVSAEVALRLAKELNTTAAFILCLTDVYEPEVACVPA